MYLPPSCSVTKLLLSSNYLDDLVFELGRREWKLQGGNGSVKKKKKKKKKRHRRAPLDQNVPKATF